VRLDVSWPGGSRTFHLQPEESLVNG
jgi:hypothetical protein